MSALREAAGPRGPVDDAAPRAGTGEPGGRDDADGSGGPSGVAPRSLGWLLTIAGVLGFVASFVLTVERFMLAEDPSYIPSCSVGSVFSCGSVMESEQAALFGFPNPLLGIAAFAVATTLGALVLSGSPLPRWAWLGLQVGITAGLVMVAWLIASSLYSIGALCPYCMVVWAAVIPMFWSVTATNLERRVVPTPRSARGAVAALSDYRVVVIVATFLLVLVLVAARFWTSLSSLV